MWPHGQCKQYFIIWHRSASNCTALHNVTNRYEREHDGHGPGPRQLQHHHATPQQPIASDTESSTTSFRTSTIPLKAAKSSNSELSGQQRRFSQSMSNLQRNGRSQSQHHYDRVQIIQRNNSIHFTGTMDDVITPFSDESQQHHPNVQNMQHFPISETSTLWARSSDWWVR